MAKRKTPTVHLHHRPGTQDEHVFREVLAANEYRLPERFKKTDVIIDVGAHIGITSVCCLFRGAGTVYCYEPDADNFVLLQENLGGHKGAHAIRAAIWRSDIPVQQISFSGYPGGYNACGTVLPGFGVSGLRENIPVAAVGLDQAIYKAVGDRGKVRLLKIDCEGSEYPVLYSSRRLHQIEEMVGEIHELVGKYPPSALVPGYESKTNMKGLVQHLRNHGFEVIVSQRNTHDLPVKCYDFFAKRIKGTGKKN